MPILADGQALSRENLIISADIVPSAHRRSGLLMVASLEHDWVACMPDTRAFLYRWNAKCVASHDPDDQLLIRIVLLSLPSPYNPVEAEQVLW